MMLSRTADFIREKRLIGAGDRVLCMVSGGADSVAMLHLLSRLASEGHPSFSEDFSLGICHVNYGRRGHDSDADESHVRSLGDSLGFPVHVIQAPPEPRPNFQAWARGFRYLAAQNLCRWQGYTRIAVAHNRDDRIETFLYRLITYSGRRSLVVMPPQRGHVIRPLLFATSDEVRDFCNDRGIGYRDDESNFSLDYARNRIRQLVVPRLAEISPDFRERIADTLSLLEDEDRVLADVTAEAWSQAVLGSSPAENGMGSIELSAAELSAMPRATARLVIRRWLSGANTRVRLARRVLDAVVSLSRQQQGAGTVSLTGGLQVHRSYDRLMLVPAGEEAAAHKENYEGSEVTLTVPGSAIFGDFRVEAVDSPGWEVPDADPMRAIVDADRLTGSPQLKVRPWRPGDRFVPLGLGGSKSVQDLFTDEKVPRRERAGIPIVTCGEKIVWVCGVRVSDEFRVTESTRRRVGLVARRRAVERAV